MTNELPLLSIEQSFNIYRDMHAISPSFGMDRFDKNFKADDFVILENNGDGKSAPYARCNYYILLLTIRGSTVRHINQHDYEIEGHTLQLIVPGTIHSFEDTSEKQNTYMIVFNRKYLSLNEEDLLDFHKLQPSFVNLIGGDFLNVKDIFKEINTEYKDKNTEYKEISKMLLVKLLLLLKRKKLSTLQLPKNRAEQIMTQYLNLIEEHYQSKKTVQEYANMLEITPKYLGEIVKNITKKSALHYIHIRIIKELQYLLIYSSLSINEISEIMNFESSSELGRFFKRYENISPSKYRLSFKKQ
jgi:AraC family transcriptional activator of pobA